MGNYAKKIPERRKKKEFKGPRISRKKEAARRTNLTQERIADQEDGKLKPQPILRQSVATKIVLREEAERKNPNPDLSTFMVAKGIKNGDFQHLPTDSEQIRKNVLARKPPPIHPERAFSF